MLRASWSWSRERAETALRLLAPVLDRLSGVLQAVTRAIGRVLPSSRRGRLALVGALVAAAGIVWGGNYYFADVPKRLADDYRGEAQVAAEGVADSMDRVYQALDHYIDASSLNRFDRRRLRSATSLSQRSRVMTSIDDRVELSLRRSRNWLRKAQDAIEDRRAAFADVPQAPALNGSEPIRETEDAAERGESYLSQASKFLRSFRQFVAYAEAMLELDRRALRTATAAEIQPEDDLEAIKAATASHLNALRAIDREMRQLEPHRDVKRLHELSLQDNTVLLDYLEDTKAAFDNLSLPQFEAAQDRMINGFKGRRGRWRQGWYQFTAKSSLQRSTRRLSKGAQELEQAIGSLGTGVPRPGKYKRDRPPLPAAPTKPERDEDKQRA